MDGSNGTPPRCPAAPPASFAGRAWLAFVRWFDTESNEAELASGAHERVDWLRVIPFIGMHAMCLGVIWVGFSWTALWVAVALYAARMFAITGFYHRYFSHKSFKTSRVAQFAFAVLGAASVQRGPLWWAAHHRHHHRTADTVHDVHSPGQHGFVWSHMGWFLSRAGFRTDRSMIPDLLRYPELRLLDRFDVLVPIALATALFLVGGAHLLIWGFFVSTVVLFHATVTINSLAHVFGSRRYATRDTSRNNFWLALLTFGEGWHNNHHHFPGSARQGFYWWEIDLTYYALRVLSWFRIVWDLKPVPRQKLLGS